MGSQLDLDQGGTYRQYQRIWLGPSVGWVTFPTNNVLPVVSASASPINGTTLITVNFNGAVSIQLWDPTVPVSTPANSIPGPNVGLPVTIVEVGGFASGTNIITILPAAGKTIMGLASITIQNPFGGIILKPNLTTGNWTQNP